MSRRLRVAVAVVVGAGTLWGLGALAAFVVSSAVTAVYEGAQVRSLVAWAAAMVAGVTSGAAASGPLVRPVMDRLLRWADRGGR